MFGFLKKIGRSFKNGIKKAGTRVKSGITKVTNTMNNVSNWMQNNDVFNRGKLNSLKDLTPMEQLCARINKEVYKDPNQRLPYLQEHTLEPYGTDATTVVYFNKNIGHMIIGFRGTANMQDVKTDAKYAFGKEGDTGRFRKDLDNYDKIIAFYNPAKVTITGHSLGGGICLYVNAMRNNINQVIIFNPAFNLNELKRVLTGNKRNVTIIRTPDDPVSFLSVLSNATVKTVPAGNNMLNTHKLDRFIAN